MTRRRAGAQQSGRTLRFECCEARIALSANTLGVWTLTTSAELEGGFITADTNFLSDHVSSAFPQGANTGGDNVTPLGGGQRTDELHVNAGDVEATHGRVFDDFSTTEDNVRLIAPSVGPQHPEGGQIALINLPTGVMTGMATPSPNATAKLDREPTPAADDNVGPRVSNETGGLRSRAIAFEVAGVKPVGVPVSVAERSDMSLQLSAQRIAFDGELSVAAAKSVHRQTRSAVPSNIEADARPQPTRHANVGPLVECKPASPPTLAEHAISLAGANSAHAAHAGLGRSDTNEAQAVRDAAWSEFGQDDAAPVSDSSTPSVEGRGRRVLALALVLTAGSAPLGKLVRRGTPHKTTEQRPPQRREKQDSVSA
jgi:hypothetical protein